VKTPIRMITLVLLIVGLFAAPAHAAAIGIPSTRPSPPSSTASSADEGKVVGSVRATRTGTSGTAAEDVIECEFRVDYPHHSGHVPGTVNVAVEINCTKAVEVIHIYGALYYYGTLMATSAKVNTVTSFTSATNVAWHACASGTEGIWQGWMWGYVVFPAGYEPPVGELSFFGPENYVTCP
jgi:hypothetical protein